MIQIDYIKIQNFRGIENEVFDLKKLNIIIGNNGTSKTTLLEAIYYAFSPAYAQSHVSYEDFYNNTSSPILIEIYFTENILINLQYGYQMKQIPFNRIHLSIKKRDSSVGLKKAFNSGFVHYHCLIPDYTSVKDGKGWNVRDTSGKELTVTLLQAKDALNDLPIRCFYFNKERDKQLGKGFNSSITSVFDDFNWRFLNQLNGNAQNTYYEDKEQLERTILEHIDKKNWEKSIGALNSKLNDYFSLAPINIAFLNQNTPFNSAFLTNREHNQDLPVSKLGSGIEMIVALVFLETLASLSKENIVILIDEPELHLHPILQKQLLDYFKKLSLKENIMVLLSTHSPYMFKECHDDTTNLICRNSHNDASLFPWGKTWGEINYFTYGMPTVEFFNELYGYIQADKDIKKTDACLVSKGFSIEKKWKRRESEVIDSTLPTYVRNSIHHPENTLNEKYTESELKECIDKLVHLIKNDLDPASLD